MHFENVQLPSQVIAELYKQSLVVLEDVQVFSPKDVPANSTAVVMEEQIELVKEEKPVVKERVAADVLTNVNTEIISASGSENLSDVPVQQIKYLGGYQKEIAVVVAEHFNMHIADEDFDFLSKMLSACKLSINDVAIINVVNNPKSAQLWQ